jgi:hypothetical protein
MKVHLILWGYVALIGVLLFALPAHAASDPAHGRHSEHNVHRKRALHRVDPEEQGE